ncbi:HSP20 family protein [Filimonas lacunae]|uniref:HSP20 family protein n=1 Tax=Filimonas lacunae TaxID=477680 RepID=A0A173MFH8_9BACT|nr:Hsp20/alpha crystallin family protein [Filimonas lacunae]BAV06343.1 small heat shock protein [Filimonas lacunae]SIT26547.1 HSP20 family protein [Filimonas lacunae]
MTLVKHNYRNLGNLFDEFFTSFPANNNNAFNNNVPPVNIHESTDAYTLQLVAPGLQKSDFKVNVEKGLLTISYEKKTEQEQKEQKTHRREFNVSSFKRSFTVDELINVDGIQARYENGILELQLPKKEVVKVTPKEIAIN